MSESHPAVATVMSLLVIASIMGNILVCTVIKKNRDMRTPINYLLVNLAVADILFAVFYIPKIILGQTFIEQPEGVAGGLLCTLLTNGTLAWVGASSTVLTLVAIATGRYYVVVYPYRNTGKITMCKLRFVLPGIWILSVILQIREFGKEVHNNTCIYLWSDEFVKGVSVVLHTFVFLSSVPMIFLYTRVVYTLWFKRNDDNKLTYHQQGVLKMRKRVTLMVITISVIFAVSWSTHSILHILDDVSAYALNPFAIPISHVTLMFNSAVNPFAYALINHRFKEKIKQMISCKQSRVQVVKESQGIEMGNKTTLPTPDPCSRQCGKATSNSVNTFTGIQSS